MGTGLVAQDTWIPAVRCGDATYGTDVPPDAGATLLQLITHRFSPQGVTGLALLAESHISIHTWPELGYAAVDVFTCGDHTMPEKACRELAARLQAGEQRLQSLRRDTPAGLPTPSRALAGP